MTRQPPPGMNETIAAEVEGRTPARQQLKADLMWRVLRARAALEDAPLTAEQEEAFADALDAASEVIEAVIHQTPSPVPHVRVDVDRLARSIVTAACELDGPAGPEDPDTIYITMNDLEAVVHRHVTAALEALQC